MCRAEWGYAGTAPPAAGRKSRGRPARLDPEPPNAGDGAAIRDRVTSKPAATRNCWFPGPSVGIRRSESRVVGAGPVPVNHQGPRKGIPLRTIHGQAGAPVPRRGYTKSFDANDLLPLGVAIGARPGYQVIRGIRAHGPSLKCAFSARSILKGVVHLTPTAMQASGILTLPMRLGSGSSCVTTV